MVLKSVSTVNKFSTLSKSLSHLWRNLDLDQDFCQEDQHQLPYPKALIKIEKSVKTSTISTKISTLSRWKNSQWQKSWSILFEIESQQSRNSWQFQQDLLGQVSRLRKREEQIPPLEWVGPEVRWTIKSKILLCKPTARSNFCLLAPAQFSKLIPPFGGVGPAGPGVRWAPKIKFCYANPPEEQLLFAVPHPIISADTPIW